MSCSYYIGVDVGTGSVRAGVFTSSGGLFSHHTVPITVHNPRPDFYEQSTEEIWEAAAECVRVAVAEAAETAGESSEELGSKVKGMGFDATCSMALVGKDGKGVSLDSDNPRWDVVMWMDHRAKEETAALNRINHPVKSFVGGAISVEMQTPKLLWLKRHKQRAWRETAHFFDLPDYLTWRATGSTARSLCSLVCKWTYEVDVATGSYKGWSKDFFRRAGMAELEDESFSRLGNEVLSPGSYCARLSPQAAKTFNLPQTVVVGTSLIDAHAGILGLLACSTLKKFGSIDEVLGLISGTSNCHMALNKHPVSVPGIWGPYCSAVLPGLWVLEGGQTAVGSLLDHLLQTHPAYQKVLEEAEYGGTAVQQHLESVLEELRSAAGHDDCCRLTSDIHVWPDFHGNRAPLADPDMRGAICGLGLEKGGEQLAVAYLAVMQAIAYGTRHIVEEMRSHGQTVKAAGICGGLSKSDLFVRTHADVLGIPVVMPDETETVLLGSAMLGAAAASEGDLLGTLQEMGGDGKVCRPNSAMKDYHDRKYKVFRMMGEDQIKYRRIMKDGQ